MDTMDRTRGTCSGARWLAAGAGVAAASYAAYVGVTWYRYGRPRRAALAETDTLLDGFMPDYDMVERHQIRVAAPADVTFQAAANMDLTDSAVVRALFKGRELLLGGEPPPEPSVSGPFLVQAQAIGWRTLAEVPGREIVLGAVTQPWQANPTFEGVAPDDFASFDDPGYVKIALTLRVDPLGAGASMFRTETRAVATDTHARRLFRRYWSFLSPGVVLIRRAILARVRHEAERAMFTVAARVAPP
jgi:hypothetical protein